MSVTAKTWDIFFLNIKSVLYQVKKSFPRKIDFHDRLWKLRIINIFHKIRKYILFFLRYPNHFIFMRRCWKVIRLMKKLFQTKFCWSVGKMLGSRPKIFQHALGILILGIYIIEYFLFDHHFIRKPDCVLLFWYFTV